MLLRIECRRYYTSPRQKETFQEILAYEAMLVWKHYLRVPKENDVQNNSRGWLYKSDHPSLHLTLKFGAVELFILMLNAPAYGTQSPRHQQMYICCC